MINSLQAKWAVNQNIYNLYQKWEFIIVGNPFNWEVIKKCIIKTFYNNLMKILCAKFEYIEL